MKAYKIILLLIISIITIYTGLVLLAWNTLNSTFLNENYYHNLVEETNIVDVVYREYQDLLPEIILESLLPQLSTTVDLEDETLSEELIAEEMARQELLGLIESEVLTRLEIVVISLARSFEPEWLKSQLLTAIEDIISLLKGEKSELDTTIEFRNHKQNLERELAAELSLVVDLQSSQEGDETDKVELLAAFIVNQLDIPDRISLNEVYNSDTIPAEVENTLIATQKLDAALVYWPYILFAALLLLSIILAGPVAGLKWHGASYIFLSLTFLVGLQLINTIFSAQLIGVSEIIVAGIPLPRNLVIDTIGHTTSYTITAPLIFLVVGILLFLAGFVYKAVTGKE